MTLHLIAINDYRSETSPGFANTWTVYSCQSEEQVQKLLKDGIGGHTQGIRRATKRERYRAKKFLEKWGEKDFLCQYPNYEFYERE